MEESNHDASQWGEILIVFVKILSLRATVADGGLLVRMKYHVYTVLANIGAALPCISDWSSGLPRVTGQYHSVFKVCLFTIVVIKTLWTKTVLMQGSAIHSHWKRDFINYTLDMLKGTCWRVGQRKIEKIQLFSYLSVVFLSELFPAIRRQCRCTGPLGPLGGLQTVRSA